MSDDDRASVTERVTVRAASEEDLDDLARMGAALAMLHHGWDPLRFTAASTSDVFDGYRWWFGQELSKKGVCFRVVDVASLAGAGAASAGGLAGYVYGRKEGRDWNKLLDPHVELIDVYVRPDCRRHGVGRALVQACCAWAAQKKAGPVVLSTAAKNEEAQRLFASLGFRATMIEMTRN